MFSLHQGEPWRTFPCMCASLQHWPSSYHSAEAATKEGRFANEIVSISYKKKKKQVVVDRDEHFRPDLTIDGLSGLPPAFIPKGGSVTAGNASGMNDGASAMLLMSREKANELGVKPLAQITGISGSGTWHVARSLPQFCIPPPPPPRS